MNNKTRRSVQFRPKTMLEDYLLEADAIASVLNKESGLEISLVQVTAALAGAGGNEDCLLHPRNPGSTELHAANVLKLVFEKLATMKYHKTAHGPKIVE